MKKNVLHNFLIFAFLVLPFWAAAQQNIPKSTTGMPLVQRVTVDMFTGNLPNRLDPDTTYNLNFTINKGDLASYGALVLPKYNILSYSHFNIPAGGRIYEYPNAIFIVWSPLSQQVKQLKISVELNVVGLNTLPNSIEMGVYFMFFKDGRLGRAGIYRDYGLYTGRAGQFYLADR